MKKLFSKFQFKLGGAKKFIGISALAVLGVSFIIFAFFYWATYSEGYRAGVVVKVSKKGVIFKTFEGELNTSETEKWAFSVESSEEEVLKILEEVALSKERVRLRYNEHYRTFPWRNKTKYLVYKVERIDENKEPTEGN